MSEVFLNEPDTDSLIVRTDNGTGAQELCTWKRAEEVIANDYHNPNPVMRLLALGFPVRCTFATYQHRDNVEGWERKRKD